MFEEVSIKHNAKKKEGKTKLRGGVGAAGCAYVSVPIPKHLPITHPKI